MRMPPWNLLIEPLSQVRYHISGDKTWHWGQQMLQESDNNISRPSFLILAISRYKFGFLKYILVESVEDKSSSGILVTSGSWAVFPVTTHHRIDDRNHNIWMVACLCNWYYVPHLKHVPLKSNSPDQDLPYLFVFVLI